jgi:hypothetical protein
MPVLLLDDELDVWLAPALTEAEGLEPLLNGPPEGFLKCYPVDKKLLNSGLTDVPECAENTGDEYAPLLRGVII